MESLKFRQPRFDVDGIFVEWFYWGFIDNGFIAPLRLDVPNYQYIGLKDKNSKEIWEGDISSRNHNVHYPELIGVVEWDECEAKFVWHANFPSGGGVSCHLGHYLNGHSSSHKEGESKQDEVIGNIYENPNLLETKTK